MHIAKQSLSDSVGSAKKALEVEDIQQQLANQRWSSSADDRKDHGL